MQQLDPEVAQLTIGDLVSGDAYGQFLRGHRRNVVALMARPCGVGKGPALAEFRHVTYRDSTAPYRRLVSQPRGYT